MSVKDFRTLKHATLTALGIALSACGFLLPKGLVVRGQVPNAPVKPALSQTAVAPSFDVEVVARDLRVVWSIAFAPGDKILFTERPGKVRVIEKGVPEEVQVHHQ